MKKIIFIVLVLLLLGAAMYSIFSGGDDTLEYVNIKLTDENYAFAVNEESTELLAGVNAVIKKIKENGALDKIIEKYSYENEESYNKQPMGTVNPDRAQLIVATSTPFKPFEFSKYESEKGKVYMGIDIEIAAIIAEELDLELVIKEYSFSEILSAVANGEAHIAMAGITKTQDRHEGVVFTDTYYSSSQTLIVRADDSTFDSCKTRKDVEEILSSLGSDVIAGYQSDSTGGAYLKGDNAMGYAGFNVTARGYSSAILAAQALVDKEIDFVIIDDAPAKIIVNDMNK